MHDDTSWNCVRNLAAITSGTGLLPKTWHPPGGWTQANESMLRICHSDLMGIILGKDMVNNEATYASQSRESRKKTKIIC